MVKEHYITTDDNHHYIKLYDLFDITQWRPTWKTVGNNVNYDIEIVDNTLLIFFQGSNEKIDWKRNFAFKKKPYKNMDITWRVHGGFLTAWKECKDAIHNEIESAKEKLHWPFSIIVSGYSHGSALAVLCHEWIWYNYPILRAGYLQTYAFEAPRVLGYFKVPKQIKDRWCNCFIIRNGKDIVTHMPPKIFGFTHVGDVLNTNHHVGIVKDHMPKNVKEGLLSENEKNELEDWSMFIDYYEEEDIKNGN